MRRLIASLLTIAVLAAGAYCPCPATFGERAGSSAPQAEPASCCAASSASQPAPDQERRSPCQHCDGVAAVTGAMSKDKQEKLDVAPVQFVGVLLPLVWESIPTLDVKPLVRCSRDALIHASPPDPRAVFCSFLN
jgi:hypothetical protein